MFIRVLLLFLLAMPPAIAQPTLTAPARAKSGSEVTVNVAGSSNPRDFISIVPKGSKAGFYAAYKYADTSGTAKLMAPVTVDDYEIRLLAANAPHATLASRPLVAEKVSASVQGPAQVAAGAKFDLNWTGPNNARDDVGIGDADPKGRLYIS